MNGTDGFSVCGTAAFFMSYARARSRGIMSSVQRAVCVLLASVLLTATACAQRRRAESATAPARTTAIRAARMFDAASGRTLSNAVVLVEGERIVAAGVGLAVPRGARVFDLGDVTLLPGLIDAHTHITYHFDENGRFGLATQESAADAFKASAENARLTVEAGFTTIRNLGADGRLDILLRDAVKRGEVVGPRMLVSGEPLTYIATSERAERVALIREFVRRRVAEGADVIKIFESVDERGAPAFSREEIRAAVEEAARGGLKVAVHAHEAAAVRAAVEGGCASVEHGTYLDDEAIRLLVRHHTALVPTLYLPTHYLEHKSQFYFSESAWDFFERVRARNLDNLRRAKEAGVWIVAGSDAVAGVHGHNAREIIWLVKAGMSPSEALRAATLDAARLVGLEGQTGELRRGLLADIIAVSGDPLADINNVERVQFVMKAGQVLKNPGARPASRE